MGSGRGAPQEIGHILRGSGPASMSMGACDNRITLYPAAPFRLATLLHARTIAREGWGSSTQRQIGEAKSAMVFASHTSDPPNALTSRSVGTVSLSSCPARSWRVEDRALWHQTLLDVTPKSNRQLARDSHDHNLSHPRALTCSALDEPSSECTLRLMPDPQPSGLNHNGTHLATACSRNPLAALLLAAAVGAWGKTQEASHLPPVGELAVIDLTRKQG